MSQDNLDLCPKLGGRGAGDFRCVSLRETDTSVELNGTFYRGNVVKRKGKLTTNWVGELV